MYSWAGPDTIKRVSDGALIPVNADNRDYTEAMEWVAAGNTIAPFMADLSKERTAYARRIDNDAEAVRLRYITPGAGMALTYQEKFAQAQAVAAMGAEAANAMTVADREAQFPTLAASVGIEADTLSECAELVLTKYAQFAQLSLVIERTRLTGKAAIKAATTAAAAKQAYDAIAWPTP